METPGGARHTTDGRPGSLQGLKCSELKKLKAIAPPCGSCNTF